MKKMLLVLTAAFLVTGVAFADGGKKKNKDKTTASKHEGKTCSKEDMKNDKKKKDAPAPAEKPAN
jgi:uncharacterized protein YdeI (BOF family)